MFSFTHRKQAKIDHFSHDQRNIIIMDKSKSQYINMHYFLHWKPQKLRLFDIMTNILTTEKWTLVNKTRNKQIPNNLFVKKNKLYKNYTKNFFLQYAPDPKRTGAIHHPQELQRASGGDRHSSEGGANRVTLRNTRHPAAPLWHKAGVDDGDFWLPEAGPVHNWERRARDQERTRWGGG